MVTPMVSVMVIAMEETPNIYDTHSWRVELLKAMNECGESGVRIERSTISDELLDKNWYVGPRYWDADYKLLGTPFTIWTANRVYFPAGYDSNWWIASAPRNPCAEATNAVGGGI